jgi:hypothetical protein
MAQWQCENGAEMVSDPIFCKRVVGFDNERGKGDHKHLGGKESVYRFVSVDQLLDDFLAEVERSVE